MRTLFAAGLLALFVPACIVGPGEITGTGEEEEMGGGGNGGGGGGGTGGGGGNGGGSGVEAMPRITATVDKETVSTELGKTETLTLTIQSVDGFTGSVPVTPAMMDGVVALEGFTITANPPTAELVADGTATVTLEVKVPTDAAALTPQLQIDLGGAMPTSVTSALAITNQYTVTIPAGTGGGIHTANLPLGAPLRLRSGATLVWRNADGVNHVIHGNMGVPHQNVNQGAPNTEYKITVSNPGTWYCHTHESGTQSRLVNVQ